MTHYNREFLNCVTSAKNHNGKSENPALENNFMLGRIGELEKKLHGFEVGFIVIASDVRDIKENLQCFIEVKGKLDSIEVAFQKIDSIRDTLEAFKIQMAPVLDGHAGCMAEGRLLHDAVRLLEHKIKELETTKLYEVKGLAEKVSNDAKILADKVASDAAALTSKVETDAKVLADRLLILETEREKAKTFLSDRLGHLADWIFRGILIILILYLINHGYSHETLEISPNGQPNIHIPK